MSLQTLDRLFDQFFRKETDMTEPTETLSLLRIDATGRSEGSVSRRLAALFIETVREKAPVDVTHRDLTASPPPVVDGDWIAAAYTDGAERTDAQAATLAESDALVDEFAATDAILITAPIYNFAVPAQLKLWIDQVARIGRTFAYTEDGPVPLLPDRPAVVVVPSGGTPLGSDIDFATGYLRHVLGFLGLSDVRFIEADRLIFEGEAKIAAAERQAKELAADLTTRLRAAA